MNNSLLNRLHELAELLTERVDVAENIRGRFKRAHDATVWPDLHPASARTSADIPELLYFRPSDDDSTH